LEGNGKERKAQNSGGRRGEGRQMKEGKGRKGE